MAVNVQLFIDSIKRHLPTGQAWEITGDLKAIIEAACESLADIKDYYDKILDESDPLTADDMIEEWLEMLGIQISSDATLGEKRNFASSIYTSIGGQSFDYIQGAIHQVLANVDLIELESGGENIAQYEVSGFMPYSSDRVKIESILARIAPLHCVPVYNVRPVYDGDVAQCNIGIIGRAIVGRDESSYSPTDSEIGLCAVGRVGLCITGRTS